MIRPEGDLDLIPAERAIALHLHGVSANATATVTIDGQPVSSDSSYGAATETLTITGIQLDSASALRLTVSAEGALLSRRDRKREKILTMLRFFRLNAGIRNRIAGGIDAILADPTALAPDVLAMTGAQARALFETICDAGVYAVTDTDKPVQVIVWNNQENKAITYRYRDVYLRFGFQRGAPSRPGRRAQVRLLHPAERSLAQRELQRKRPFAAVGSADRLLQSAQRGRRQERADAVKQARP